jgi:hypothetical protein
MQPIRGEPLPETHSFAWLPSASPGLSRTGSGSLPDLRDALAPESSASVTKSSHTTWRQSHRSPYLQIQGGVIDPRKLWHTGLQAG